MNELEEVLAALAHRQWSGWMRYLFSKGTFHRDGSFTIPDVLVERWQRQLNTEYKKLSEHEKDSDRKEARRVMQIIEIYNQEMGHD